MSVDHLTTMSPYRLATAIRILVTSADPATIAAEYGITPTDLADLTRTYHAGGLAALEQRAERGWYDVRVEFPDWATAETTATSTLGPALDTLHTDRTITGWWFLRKYPCWRLRLHHADTQAVDRMLTDLTKTGHLARWWPTIYEPETAAFGGARGITIVHDLFHADSRGVLDHLRQARPALGRRELSALLLTGLFHGAGLDTFERGDVFHRVAQLRPTPTSIYTDKINQLANALRPVLTVNDPARTDLFVSPGPATHATDWLTAFEHAGHQLGDAAARGRLDRGLRATITHIVIFHWNRLGLSATNQAVLAYAASTALLPKV